MKIRRERKKKDKDPAEAPLGSGETGLPEDVRVMHAEESNPHDG